MQNSIVRIGHHVGNALIRVWLPGTPKEIVAQLKSKGFNVQTTLPKKEAKPEAAKKSKKSKKKAKKK